MKSLDLNKLQLKNFRTKLAMYLNNHNGLLTLLRKGEKTLVKQFQNNTIKW